MCWQAFPNEIRCQILKEIARDESNIFNSISVCRQWRQALETTAFRQVYVKLPHLPNLIDLAYSRRELLERIAVHTDLPGYDGTPFLRNPSSVRQNAHRSALKFAIDDLLRRLSRWEASDRRLLLDLGVSCSTDKKYRFDADGWRLYQRFEQNPLHIGLPQGFRPAPPQVLAVTDLEIRRQSNRYLEIQSIVQLLASLPLLRTISWEPRRELAYAYQVTTDAGYWWMLEAINTGRLEKLTIFEDFNEYAPAYYPFGDPPVPGNLRPLSREVSRSLFQLSKKLEFLSVSFLIDATNFLSPLDDSTWTKLNSLTLTSGALKLVQGSCMEINTLFQQAALFAMKCPNLQNLTLWNYSGDNTCAFIYQTSPASTTLTWRATWTPIFEPATILEWGKVALAHSDSELDIIFEELDIDTALESRGHAIQQLKMPCEVIHPQSLEQIVRESELRRAYIDGLNEVANNSSTATLGDDEDYQDME